MRSLFTGRSPSAFAMLLSMCLLLAAAISATIGYRGDVLVLASYGVALLHSGRCSGQQLSDTLHIERSGAPIHLQIRDQVLRAIDAGVLRPGEKMPTMRQVAVALRVDLNTVRHAYDALAQTGAITIQLARGRFITETPAEAHEAEQADRLADLVDWTIAAAKARGLDPVEIARHVMLIEDRREARS